MKAADHIDTSKKVSLTITFRPEEISASDVEFKAYRVASVNEYADLTLTSAFGGLAVDLSKPDESVWADAVTKAESYVSENAIKPNYTAVTDESGVAVLSGMPVGLYLIKGDPFISDAHDVYTPQAYLVMFPNRTENGEWEYDAESVPKYTKSDEIIDIEVIKKWSGGKAEERPETITVTLFCDDVEYETVSFGDMKNWKYSWEELNAKHTWTISEVSVEGYTTTIEPDGYNFIITNKSNEILPQTGLMWWPIVLIAFAGVTLVFVGAAIIKKNGKADEKE